MNKAIILGVAALALTGCAKTIYAKPGATQQDFIEAKYACEKDFHQSTFGGGILGEIEAMNFPKDCMHAHGWYEAGNSR